MEASDRAGRDRRELPMLIGDGALVLFVGRSRSDRHLIRQKRARARRDEPDPLAEPLARRAAEPGTFFQNDFAGRIANRVMQTGEGAARERRCRASARVWYIGVYGVTRVRADDVGRLAARRADLRSGSIGYVGFLRYFVPRLRELARANSEGRSHVMGRVVDSDTNILT